MSEQNDPQASRASASSPWGKCDARMETAIPTEYKEKFEALARLSSPSKSPAELLRDLACKYVVAELVSMGRMVPAARGDENPGMSG